MLATTSLFVLATLAPHSLALPSSILRPPSVIRRSADANTTGVFGPDSNLWAQMTAYNPVADYVPPPSNCEIDQVGSLFCSKRGHKAKRLVARGLGVAEHASHGARLGRVLSTLAAQMPGRTFLLPRTDGFCQKANRSLDFSNSWNGAAALRSGSMRT